MSSFDKIFEKISGNGLYYIPVVGVILLVSIVHTTVMTSPVFLAGYPPSRCKVDPYDNKTAFPNLTNQLITELFIPWNSAQQSYDRCLKKVRDCENWEDCIKTNATFKVTSCDSYIYDRSDFTETIITEWNLVCEDFTWVSLSTSISFVGALISSLVGGYLADRFGRMTTIKVYAVLLVVLGCGVSFSPNMLLYTVIHCLEVFAGFAILISGVVYISEIVPPRWRVGSGMLCCSCFGLGCIVLSLYAAHWRKWREQQLWRTLSLCLPLVVATFVLPESPRWSFAKGRNSEAKNVCQAMAKWNRIKWQDSLWTEFLEAHEKDASEMKNFQKANTMKQLFEQPFTRCIIICSIILWLFTSFIYYGLMLNTGALAGNPFINNALSGLMEFLVDIFGVLLVSYAGYVKTNVMWLSLSGLACLASAAITEFGHGIGALSTLNTVLAMIARLGAGLTFSVLYLQATSLYPTCGRSTAVGLSTMSARVSGIIIPLVIQLQHYIPWLTQVLIGVASLLGAITASAFPETKDHELTMTYTEAEEFFRHEMKNTLTAKVFGLNKQKISEEKKENETFLNEADTVL